MSLSLARQLGGIKNLETPFRLTTFDGSDASSGPVTQSITASLDISGHVEETTFFLTHLEQQYPIVLGLPWLQRHNPVVDWRLRTMSFDPETCRACQVTRPIVVSLVAPTSPRAPSPSPQPAHAPPPSLLPSPRPAHAPPPSPPPAQCAPSLDIRLIGAVPFARQASRSKTEVFTARYSDVCKALLQKDPLALCAAKAADIAKALEDKPRPDPKTLLPSEFHDFLDVFSRQAADRLPPHRSYDHHIELQPGKEHGYGPLYSMSRDELKVLCNRLCLEPGFRLGPEAHNGA